MKKIYVVGIGPGDISKMTREAISALEKSDVIIGYKVYVDLLKPEFPDKEYAQTPMRQEVKRCEMAFEIAEEGKTVSMVSSGDAGVYGMAGLMLEIGEKYPDTSVEVIPGVSAVNAGAAVLGAPLMHDYCTISLSDLLTPMDKILKRIECAAIGDFVISIYNPSSKKRHDYLQKACDILLKYRDRDTVCATVRNIGREGEEKELLTLSELREKKVDMFTTVFVGNSETRVIGDFMVTPRGYKYES